MVFSSLLFLFRFLPVFLLCYFLAPGKFRNGILFFGSLIFYGWGEPVYITLLLFSTLVDFYHGKLVDQMKTKGKSRAAKCVVASSVAVNMALLIVFKYTDFLIGSFNSLSGAGLTLPGLALPIGISFYTFQTMSYTIDVYRGEAPVQKNIISFGAYVSMFPQLIAGPIVRYRTIAKELTGRRESAGQFAAGVRLFVIGLGKKVLLANQAGALWTEITGILPGDRSVLMVWTGILAFAFQIYFDFSGYSDMASGLGLMLGFHFPANFNYPYISRSITEFWRRWHISLGTWFREYVYIPLGGNRKGTGFQIRNILIVWLLTGIWHGASLNFLFWGIYFGILLLLEKFLLKDLLERFPGWARQIYTFLLVLFGWVLFAFDDMQAGLSYLLQMTGAGGLNFVNQRTLFLLSGNAVLLFAAWIGSTPVPAKLAAALLGETDSSVAAPAGTTKSFSAVPPKTTDSSAAPSTAGMDFPQADPRQLRRLALPVLEPLFLAAVLLLSTAYLVDATYNPFLYFRF